MGLVPYDKTTKTKEELKNIDRCIKNQVITLPGGWTMNEKRHWLCRLIGHNFRERTIKIKDSQKYHDRIFCVRCGLIIQ